MGGRAGAGGGQEKLLPFCRISLIATGRLNLGWNQALGSLRLYSLCNNRGIIHSYGPHAHLRPILILLSPPPVQDLRSYGLFYYCPFTSRMYHLASPFPRSTLRDRHKGCYIANVETQTGRKCRRSLNYIVLFVLVKVDEMLWELNASLYQLACGKAGLVVCRFAESLPTSHDVK